MSGSSDSQGPSAGGHGWDASGTLWNPVTMSSHAAGPSTDGIPAKLHRSRGRSSGRAICQVPGCTESLVDCKPYFKRHLVCQTHAVSPTVSIDGVEMRFCQQCAKFERVTAFDGGNRSCRFRLFRRNVAKHRSQLAKRAAQSSDEPEVRPARQSQAPKTARVAAHNDAALGTTTTTTTGDLDVDGAAGADAGRQPAGSPSVPQPEASGRSSGEPDTRCWDAEPNPSQYWGMTGSEDWRCQATSGPSSHSTKRTKVALPAFGSTAALGPNGALVDSEALLMGAVRVPQQKRRQRAASTRTRDESNSESRTMLSQDVNDDVDATLAPFTLGLRLDMPGEDTTEPSATRAGEAGRLSASEAQQHMSGASPVRGDTLDVTQQQQLQAHLQHQHRHAHAQQTSARALMQMPAQLRQSGRARGEPGRDARLGWQPEAKDALEARSSRLLEDLPSRGSELYDALSTMSTEPAERYAAEGGGVTADEAVGQRLRAMASGMSSLGLRVGGMELTAAGSSGASDTAAAAHVPLALQSLSSRLDLTRGDRMTLESLLGLSTGPVALRCMASSTGTSLDEQLYDILHDVIKEGGGDTGWFKGTGVAAGTVAAAAAAAPGRAVHGGAGVAGPMAAAYAYLGVPPPMRPEERLGALTLGRTESGGGGGQAEISDRVDSMQRDLFDGSRLQGARMPPQGVMAGQPRPSLMTTPVQQQMQQQMQHQHHQLHVHRPQQRQPQGLLQPTEQQLRLQQQQQPAASAAVQLQELHEEERNLEQKLQELQQRKVQLLKQEHHHHPRQQMQPQQMQPQQMQPQQMQPQQMQPQQMQPQQMHPQQMQPQQMQPQQMHPQHAHPRMMAAAPAMEPTPTSMLQHAHSAAAAAMAWSGARAGMAARSPHGYGMDPRTATASAAAAAAGPGLFTPTGPHPQQPQQQPMTGHGSCEAPSHGGAFGMPGHGMAASHPQTQMQPVPGRPCTLPPALLRPQQQLPPAVQPPAPAMPKPDPMASQISHPGWAGSGWGDVPPTLRGVASGGSSGDCEVDAGTRALAGWGLAARDATESPWDDYQGHYETVRLSLKMMDCTPYDMDPSTQDLLHQFACEGGRCAAPPPLASVRPGCVRIVVDATVRLDRDRGQQWDPHQHQPSFSVRAGEALAAVRRLAVLNETAVLVQAGSQVLVMDKAGREVAAESLSPPSAAPAAGTPPVLSRASMAAVYVGARGCFQVFGTGLSGPNVEFWGRMHGVHYQLQVHHTAGDTYALVQLPVLTCCGLLVVEAGSGSDASLLSDWLAIVVVPSERVANELNGLQSRLPQASLRRLLVDLGSLLDILPILSQPVNGVCPVVGHLAGASSGCSKNTWRSSSVEPDAGVPEGVCGGGLCGGTVDSMDADASSEAPATEAGVLSYNMSYSGTDSTLASSHDGPHKSSSTVKTSLPSIPSVFGGGAGAGSYCISGFGGASSAAAGASAGASGAAGAALPPGGTALKLSTQLLASIADRNGGAAGNANVRRLLRGFDPSELLTNGDDETVVQQLLAPEAVRQLLARSVSVATFFAQRLLVDSALCAVSAVSELYCAFPDLLDGQLAPRPQRGAPCLMHAAVRSRSLALLLALAKCGPVLGDHVSLAWPGPNGITPLHLVALLAQPYVITGLQFVVPEVRELWYTLRDDNGVTPADLLAEALQRQAPRPAAAAQEPAPEPEAGPELPTGMPWPATFRAARRLPVGTAPVSLERSRVGAVGIVGTTAESAGDASEAFLTPLPSPPDSASTEHDADLTDCAVGGPDAAGAQVPPSPSALWPGWGDMSAVVNQQLPLEQDVRLPPPPQDEDLGRNVTLLAAGMGELSVAGLRRNGRPSTDSWTGSVAVEEMGSGSEFDEAAACAAAQGLHPPRLPPPLVQQQHLVDAHQPQHHHQQKQQQPPQGASTAVAALTGVARNVARRLMPW